MKKSDVYAEVYELLGYIDKVTVMKIPVEILKKIKSERNKRYVTKIDKNDIFNRNNVLPETIKYMAWLDVNFWEPEEEKERLRNLYKDKIIQEEIEKSKEFGNYELFKNKPKVNGRHAIIEYKEGWREKIVRFIKMLFKREK